MSFSKTIYVGFAISTSLLFVTNCVYAADSPAFYSGLIDAATLQSQSVSVGLENAHVYVPAGTLATDTRIKIRDRGDIAQTHVAAIPKKYRTHAHVYTYFFEGDFKENAATVILHYVPGKTESRKKTIFYQPLGDTSGEWTRLQTIADPEDDTIEALLPTVSGRVVFARHRYKHEQPTHKFDFTAYGGTPYSDTAAVLDLQSGKFLYTQEADKRRSIASVSKLATTLVFLETNPDLSQTITYSSSNDQEGVGVNVASGDQLLLNDVLMSALIPSANNMAATLSTSTSMTQTDFIARMNEKMQALGLTDTSFAEPTGLNPDNQSTADNISRLARAAFTEFPDVYDTAASYSHYNFSVQNTGRQITVYSTNKFDGHGKYETVAFKTGYLPPYADRTLVMEINEIASGHKIIVTLLGDPQYNTIFQEAYDLADWTFSNWEFQNYN